MTIIDLYTEQDSDLIKTITLNEDITDYTISSALKGSNGTVWNNIATISDYITGEISINIDNSITNTLSSGVGYYQVEITSSTGVRSKPIKGRVYVDEEIK